MSSKQASEQALPAAAHYEGNKVLETEDAVIAEWQEMMGASYEVVVAQMSKLCR